MLRSAIDRWQGVHSASLSFVSRFDLAYNAAYALTWMKMIKNHLDKLTVDDLQEWAGEKIFARGKSYLRRVSGLSQAVDGKLVAWVTGSERYATSVHVSSSGALTSFCTCPYDWEPPCKHAVAVVLAAAEHVKQGKAIPVLDGASKLARVLADDEKDDGEAYYEDDEGLLDEPVTRHHRQKQPSFQELQNILQGWSKDKLVAWLAEQGGRDPELAQSILEAHQLDSGQADKLVRSLRKEIWRLTAEPAWSHPWYDDAQLPDYSHLQRQLSTLLDRGHYDALLELGEELWQGGMAQVEQADDEGETALAIAECLEVVLEALPHSSLPSAEQLIWVIDHLLEDDYSLLEAGEKLLESPQYGEQDWQMAARSLEVLLNGEGALGASRRYQRLQLVGHLQMAYARGGWPERILPLLEREVDVCWNYEQLVDALLAAGERGRARQWCIHGYAKTVQDARGIAERMREKLHELALAEGRYDLACAYRAESFFCQPSLAAFSELHEAAKQAGEWGAVRVAVLAFLETGLRPDLGVDAQAVPRWPLPSSELAHLHGTSKPSSQKFPELDLLISIAILEQRHDDVVALYRRWPKTPSWNWDTEKRVAEAVAASHPDIALAIWRAIVDGLIAKVQPSAYMEAAGYLRRMRQVYQTSQRGDEWQALMDHLRKTHKAKRRLQEVLDNLSGAKLV